jgi:tRNA modification GTPase
VLEVEALVTYSIDFPEEDEPPVPPARVDARAAQVLASIDALLATAPEGELLREGALVVLAGRPNSGKSSLFNALLGTERAIVTEVPGTTRDALEAEISIHGFPFRLVDTAGLRETTDRVEGIGIEVARRYLRAAQLVLYCAEAGREVDPEEHAFLAGLEAQGVLLVRTKADARPDAASIPGAVSVLTGAGLPELREELLRLAFGRIAAGTGEAPLVTRERHARALRAARQELELFRTALHDRVPMEFAATHLRAAAGSLEDLIGLVTSDDVLGVVFGQFCVGK